MGQPKRAVALSSTRFDLAGQGDGNSGMRTWTGQKAYKDWSALLATSEEDDFERKVLPLLRVFWPALQQSPRKRTWDAKGIDLLVWAEHGPLPCVVQCKGFKVRALGADQARQVENSIEKFRESDTEADTYLLIHNRDPRDREFEVRVNEALARLLESGKARYAELWDRQTLLQRVFDEMERRLNSALRARSRELLQHFQDLFRFGRVCIASVPAVREEITFRRDSASRRRTLESSGPQDVASAIAHSSGTEWTIVTGAFGVGKTTAALHAATSSDRPVVVLPCASLSPEVFSSGQTNTLTRHAVRVLDVLDDLSTDDQARLERIAACVLSYLLRVHSSPFIFVLDGLDENRAFTSLAGLQRLANQVAEFACPVVLTTRREHLDLMLGDFNVALSGLARKYGEQRVATGLHLQFWTLRESLAVLDEAIKLSTPEEAARLDELRKMATAGQLEAIYGDLVVHPLFLQFILEDAITHGVRRQDRPSLLKGWIERKLRRDRQAWAPGAGVTRLQVRDDLDTDEAVERTMGAMQRVAFEMTERVADRVVLTESIAASRLLLIVEKIFDTPMPRLLPFLLNSVMVLHERRSSSDQVVGFAFRILQEYLLACFLETQSIDPTSYPEAVRSLFFEMVET